MGERLIVLGLGLVHFVNLVAVENRLGEKSAVKAGVGYGEGNALQNHVVPGPCLPTRLAPAVDGDLARDAPVRHLVRMFLNPQFLKTFVTPVCTKNTCNKNANAIFPTVSDIYLGPDISSRAVHYFFFLHSGRKN